MKRDQWQQVEGFPHVWTGQYIVPNFCANAIAIFVSDQQCVLISPGASLLADWEARWPNFQGKLQILLPNAYHFMGVQAWQQRFPGATLHATRKAIVRLQKKGIHGVAALEDALLTLPEQSHCLIPPGHRGGDAWVSLQYEERRMWVTCDTFLNYARLSNQPIARTLQRLLGTAPGLRIGEVIRWFILDERKTFKGWVLEQLQREQPQCLIPGHGEIEQDAALTSRLTALVHERL